MIEWCNANQGFVMTVLTLVYVIATIAIVLLARHSNKIAQANLQTLVDLEREKSRPLIDVDLVPDSIFLSLHVSNRGLTPAYDVQFSITPTLTYLEGHGKNVPLAILDNGLTSLAPGSTTKTLIGSFKELKDANPTLQYTGEVVFKDANGRSYKSPVNIDLRWREKNYYINRNTIHDVAVQLEEIKQEFKFIANGFHKPHVITQDAKEKREEDEALREMVMAEKDSAG
ncbi:hypothetical protein [Tichowtungia aerotolerans]|uniref:Uncharacterized protein n=1 Tax=Tichowtungia aerotolerans TaxID=2697043 RepID=A0A6P1M423_9BACT|nr:hypothetical protein [Tichowtungia aerotolerans]QHI68587.1 hypothetical protein GT409_03690 [Tichowtungia aerotolerans]